MASTQQQQQQQDNWFASIEKEVIQNQSRQQPTRRSARSASTGTASAPLSANSRATPRPSDLDHNRDDYFALQSCLNSGAQTRNTPQQKDPTYQQRLLAMIPDTPSISLNTLSLSNVIPASVPNMQSIFGRSTTLPAKQMESSAPPPATGFGNNSSSQSSSTPAPHSQEILSFSSSPSNPPLNVASAYPSSNSMLTSTYNSTKAAVASFSLGFSSDSTSASSNSQYTPSAAAGFSGKVAQAYPGQTSLLNSTKAAVSKLAQTVTSATTRAVSSSKSSSPTRQQPGYAYGYGGGGEQRDSSSTLYDGSGRPTNSSSWSKANDSWGGFVDDGEKPSLRDVADGGRSSESGWMAEALQPW
ncbi:hypothetical protein HDU77_009685 [Chytriomyces hyalinus]|nr:hypothetical protein HDU77_009685 [Chytriomyces hyalinus]